MFTDIQGHFEPTMRASTVVFCRYLDTFPQRASARILLSLLMVAVGLQAFAQQKLKPVPAPTLGIEDGTLAFVTPDFTLRIGKDSGVAVELRPSTSGSFDFLPSDRLNERASNGFVHLGDLSFRVRPLGSSEWLSADTYRDRRPVDLMNVPGALAAESLAKTLPADCPLQVERVWRVIKNHLQLSFKITNPGQVPIEIGSLGIAMPFNNIISGRDLAEAHAKCSFTDPYIGEDAGYLRVTELNGVGPTMVVTPTEKTPLEAWRLVNEPMRPNQTFEGMMEWTVHTKAYAEKEWKGVQQWNEPTETILKPGESRTYGVQFTPAQSIRGIEDTLQRVGRPVAVGFPGYVLPMDQDAKLFLKYGKSVKSIHVEPRGAISWSGNREGNNGWMGYSIRGRSWGRARLTIDYEDGLHQVVSYDVIKPSSEAVADLGHFLTTKSWFQDDKDPFGRSSSVISYDREADKQVVQDSRVWIAGLGDEGGSGSWLAAMMKNFGQPKAEEVAKLEAFVDRVLWGNLQFKEGPKAYGVRKSLFYYDPALVPGFTYDPKLNWTSWTSWSKEATNDIGRGYNYPHVVAAYWALYRVARNHPSMAKAHPWTWYLDQAYRTTEFLTSTDSEGNDRVGYWRLGLMEGDIFVALLNDLRREGWKDKADLIEARMKARADRWKGEAYPFGSEMAWDSTGQEEVYAWCKFFGYNDKALVSLNSILAYDTTVPHWGYNGNARRYWDFLYGGKLSRIERQIHHYGSGINAIPLLAEYRQHPDDLYLLRVGYGGTMGALSNIDQEGFASAAFHSFPSTLKWDAYSGDYGPNFFGHAMCDATYLVQTKDFGWESFGGNVSLEAGKIRVFPKDSFRNRVYLSPVGLYLTLDSGTFQSVVFDPKTKAVELVLSPSTPETPQARLRVEQPATLSGIGDYSPSTHFGVDAGAFVVPLGKGSTTLRLTIAGP
jgi:hypothetical protein